MRFYLLRDNKNNTQYARNGILHNSFPFSQFLRKKTPLMPNRNVTLEIVNFGRLLSEQRRTTPASSNPRRNDDERSDPFPTNGAVRRNGNSTRKKRQNRRNFFSSCDRPLTRRRTNHHLYYSINRGGDKKWKIVRKLHNPARIRGNFITTGTGSTRGTFWRHFRTGSNAISPVKQRI